MTRAEEKHCFFATISKFNTRSFTAIGVWNELIRTKRFSSILLAGIQFDEHLNNDVKQNNALKYWIRID